MRRCQAEFGGIIKSLRSLSESAGPVPKVRDPCVDFQCRGGYETVGRVYSDEITPTAGVIYEGTNDARCRL